MIIKKKRIRKFEKYSLTLSLGTNFYVGIKINETNKDFLNKIGLNNNPSVGDSILPNSSFGPISLYNAEGKYIKHKDRPMETVYREAEWHWTEWDGTERSKVVDVPYQRYPRTFIAPPSIELSLIMDGDDDKLLISPILKYDNESLKTITHTVNLFLEIFGECELFNENMEEVIRTPLKRLNWKILPPGIRPWPELKRETHLLLNNVPESKKIFIEKRLETINSYEPSFTAIGEGGFSGYIVLGFPEKNLYILESLYYGNATYIFKENWEVLSQKTKAEILNNSLQEDRIIHALNWTNRMSEQFK